MPRRSKKIKDEYYYTPLYDINIPFKVLREVDAFIDELVSEGKFNRLATSS